MKAGIVTAAGRSPIYRDFRPLVSGERPENPGPIPVNDIWIGAACANAGATLLTFDPHFAAMPRIGTIILD